MLAVSAVNPYVTIARFAASRERHNLVAVLSALEAPGDEIVAVLRRHTLIWQTLVALGDGDEFHALPASLRDALEPWRRRRWPSPARLLSVYSQAAWVFRTAGGRVLVVKGFHFGERLYGGPERRPQFDVDLLVRARDFKRASRTLQASGFERHGYDAHSRTLRFDGVKLDLHHGLARAPAFSADEQSWWKSAVSGQTGGVTYQTLSDEWALVQLLHATYEDVGQGMARLRQLVDLFLLVRELDRTLDWTRFFETRRAESFDVVAVNVLALLTALFGAARDWPRLTAALEARSAVITSDSIEKATPLVFAGRKQTANFQWFASLYPGSLAAYLAWFWFHGFPSNVTGLTASRLIASVRLAAAHRVEGRPPSRPASE